MQRKFYFLKSFCLVLILLAGQVLFLEAQVVGELVFMVTHDTDIGEGHNNEDVGHKVQIRMANTTLSNPASYDTYLKFNITDSVIIPEGMKVLSAKAKVSTTTNQGPDMPDFVVLHVTNDNWNEDATIPLAEAPDVDVVYTDTLDRTSFTGGNATFLSLDVTKALLKELEDGDDFMTIRVDNLAESFYAAGAKDIIFETDPTSWMYGWTPPKLHVYYGHEPDSIFSDITNFGNTRNYTTMIYSGTDKRIWYNEIGIWDVVEDEGDVRFKLCERPAPINGTPGSYAFYNLDSFGDFDISVKAKVNKIKSGALDPKADFIIVFGYKGYLDYTYMRFTGEDINGFYKVDTTDGGTNTEIGALNATPAFSDTMYHDYRLVRSGTSVTAYVDGVEYMTVDDPLLGIVGKIGMGSYNDVAFFDNFVEGGGPGSVPEVYVTNFMAYPNPVSDVLTINANTEIHAVIIQNILGQNIRGTDHIYRKTTQLDVSGLQTGIYFIKIYDERGESTVRKIIKK